MSTETLAGAVPVTGNLLVVDDDEGVRQTFSRLLQLEGHHVRTAPSAADGLREVDAELPDAIILDLRMPLMDGLGFVTRLRKKEPGLYPPVVIVTGDYFVEENLTKELRTLGVEVRYKPLWLEDLIDLARGLLASSRREHSSIPRPAA
jgi:DNA-binding response OmpR family regulator